MVRCSVLHCKSDSERKVPGLSFHSFPDSAGMRNSWIAVTGRKGWTPRKTSKICSKHFHAHYLLKKKTKTQLHCDAIPYQDPVITTTPSNEESEDTGTNNDFKENAVKTESTFPRPIEVRTIKKEIEEYPNTSDIETENQEIKEELVESEIPVINNAIPDYGNESSFFNPDISKSFILKSILTRKSPVKKDMTKDQFAFNSNIFKSNFDNLNTDAVDQSNLDSTAEKFETKINIISLPQTEVCIFCDKKERRRGTQRENPVTSTEEIFENTFSFAESAHDTELLEKLKDKNTISYHPFCITEYKNKHEKLFRKNSHNKNLKNLHEKAFEGICAFIDENIISKNKAYSLSDLNKRYQALIHEIRDTKKPRDVERYLQQNLQEKIVNRYNGIIEIKTTQNPNEKIVSKSDNTSPLVENDDLKYENIAFELRSEVKSRKRTSNGKSDIPDKIIRFISSLIQGPGVRKNSDDDRVKIKSICKDIVDQINKG